MSGQFHSRWDVEIRPSGRALRWPAAALVPVALVVVWAYALLSLSGLAMAATIGVSTLGSAAILGYAVVATRRSALLLDGERLVFRNAAGRLRPVISERGGGAVARVVVFDVHQPNWQLWLDADGRCQASLTEDAWPADELEQLRARLELPIEYVEEPMTVQEVSRRYPKSIPLYIAHPIPTAIVAWLAVLAVYGVWRAIAGG